MLKNLVKNIIKIIIGIAVFIAVAVGTAFFVNKINNRNMDSVSIEMSRSKLPIVFCEYDDEVVNLMRGYTQPMSTSLMREGIVPLNENHGVDFLVYDDSSYGNTYSYELRTIAGNSLIESGDIAEGSPKQGYIEYNVNLRMDTKINREYALVFIISNTAGEQARYYTRVVDLQKEYANKVISYAQKFHNTTFTKEVDEEEGNLVYNALKTTEAGSNDDLSHVSLSSSYSMVSWAGMNPIVMTAIIPTITEIDEEYVVVKLSYVVATRTENEEHYYNIDEFYSAKYNEAVDSVDLLAFDRYQESIFDASYISKERNSISLGITDINSAEYCSAKENRKVSFVKSGQLWLYDYDTTDLTTIFDMQHGDYSDLRSLNTDIDINIASLDDDGNVYFVVYGYFARGNHEGKNGISLFHYTSEETLIEELCFVECDEPFGVMNREVGRFTYYDNKGYLYYLLDGSIYRVNLDNMTQDVLVSGIPSDKYIVSENRKIVVYPDSERDENVTKLTQWNFETGVQTEMSGKPSDRFLALGFVGNDLIYGISNQSDIITASGRDAILPMYQIFINDENGNELKKYNKSDIYIMDADVQTDNIYLTRATKNNNFFDTAEPDYISYKKENNTLDMSLNYSMDDIMLKLVDITFPSNMYLSSSYLPIMTKQKTSDKYQEMKVATSAYEDVYYIFNNTGYAGEYNSAGRAVLAVNEEDSGIVVDSNGNVIYRKLEADSYNTVADSIDEQSSGTIDGSLMACAYMCIKNINKKANYEDVKKCDSWENAFEEYSHGVGINLSGVSLDIALYFLDRDVPFAAQIDDGRYVLVISYNSTHIRYYDPVVGEEVKVTREAFNNSLSLKGNTIYTYTSQ